MRGGDKRVDTHLESDIMAIVFASAKPDMTRNIAILQNSACLLNKKNALWKPEEEVFSNRSFFYSIFFHLFLF